MAIYIYGFNSFLIRLFFRYLLDTYGTSNSDRFGSYVFNDQITVNITANWTWIGDNLESILSNQASIESALQTFGILDEDETLVDLVNSNGAAIDIVSLLPIPFTTLNATLVENQVDNFIENLFGNNTSITIQNQTVYKDDLIDFVDELIFNNTINGTLSLTNVTIEATVDRIIYVNDSIVLVDVTLIINNQSISIGNVTITIDQLISLLPIGIVNYVVYLPSPYTVLHNSTSPHGIAAFMGETVAAAFQTCIEGKQGYDDVSSNPSSYFSYNHPLPLTARQNLENQVILSIFASLFILIPLCYIPASFVVFVVKERVSKSKHLQLVSSISPYLYWIATYVWDMILYSILALTILLTFYCYGKQASRIFVDDGEATLAVFLLLILYGASAIPLSYLYSLLFDNHSTAQISIMTINFITGFVAVFAYFIMISIPSTKSLGEQLVHLFRLFPPYNIGTCMHTYQIFTVYLLTGI